MAGEPRPENTLRSNPEPRSQTIGDVPETIRHRYYTDDRGGPGLGFYVDAQIVTAAFRDRGRALTAARADPNAVRDMLQIAQHRGWRSIEVQGSHAFRREAWLAGRAMGLEMSGFRAGERDLQELERRRARRTRLDDELEVRTEQRQARRNDRADEREVRRERRGEGQADATGRAQLRVVDAVVRARVNDPARREQILAAARERVADWLERGARFEAMRGTEPGRDAGRRERVR